MSFQSRFIKGMLCLCLLFPFVAEAKLKVVATITDLAAIAQEVGGDKIEVTSLTKGTQDPHYIDPKPSMILQLNKADVLIEVGASLEVGWLPTLTQNSRNRNILPGGSGRINASERIHLLEVPTTKIDRSMGDVHPEGNPHYSLHPQNGLIIAEQIAERLQTLDPGNAEVYDRNLNRFRQDLTARIANWEARMATYRNQKIVAYHKQWEYLSAWFQLTPINYVEDKPGIPPSPKHIELLIQQMRAEKVRVLLSTNLIGSTAPEQVAKQANAKLVMLPIAVGGEKDIKTYADLFEHIVSELETAFKE